MFEKMANIETKILSDILWQSYGKINSTVAQRQDEIVSRRTVPSAGGLFPLRIFLWLKVASDSIEPGLYEITYPEPMIVGFRHIEFEKSKLEMAFNQRVVLNNTIGCVIVSGDIEKASQKYGNRAFRYCYLDAGHVAQNMLVATSEKNLASLEVAGFNDSEVSSSLKLQSGEYPLISLFFGKEADHSEKPKLKIDGPHKFEKEIGGSEKCFYAKAQRITDGVIITGVGRSKDEELAKIKAVSETVEWALFDRLRANQQDVVVGKYSGLKNTHQIIHPDNIASYSKEQLKINGLNSFNEDQEIEWVKTTEELTGKTVLISADFVFYPYNSPSRIFKANSSGCATYPDIKGAKNNALLELIERDAIIVNWSNQLSRDKIRIPKMCPEIIEESNKLKKVGYQVNFLDISLDTVPVILCIIINRDEAKYAIGAGCEYNAIKALEKSFSEARAILEDLMGVIRPPKILTEEELELVLDHGYYYCDDSRIHYLEPLLSSEVIKDISSVDAKQNITCYDQLVISIKKTLGLNILEYVLTEPFNNCSINLRTVRVVVPGLTPISFGNGNQTFRANRDEAVLSLGLVNKESGKVRSMPHPFM